MQLVPSCSLALPEAAPATIAGNQKPPDLGNSNSNHTAGVARDGKSHQRGGPDGAEDAGVHCTKHYTLSTGKQLTSKFRGVCWNKKNKRWQAAINSSGKYIYLGSFISEDDAAKQFDRAAIKIRGKKAKLNFPREGYFDGDGNLLEELILPLPASSSSSSKPSSNDDTSADAADTAAQAQQQQQQQQQQRPQGTAGAATSAAASRGANGAIRTHPNLHTAKHNIEDLPQLPPNVLHMQYRQQQQQQQHCWQQQQQQPQPPQQQHDSPCAGHPHCSTGMQLVSARHVAGLGPVVTHQALGPQVTDQALGPVVTHKALGPQVTHQVLEPQVTDQVLGPQVTDQVLGPQVTDQVLGPQVTTQTPGPHVIHQVLRPEVTPSNWTSFVPCGCILGFSVAGQGSLFGLVFRCDATQQPGCGVWTGHEFQVFGEHRDEPDALQTVITALKMLEDAHQRQQQQQQDEQLEWSSWAAVHPACDSFSTPTRAMFGGHSNSSLGTAAESAVCRMPLGSSPMPGAAAAGSSAAAAAAVDSDQAIARTMSLSLSSSGNISHTMYHFSNPDIQQVPGSQGNLGLVSRSLSARLASCDLSEAFALARQAAAERGISDLAAALRQLGSSSSSSSTAVQDMHNPVASSGSMTWGIGAVGQSQPPHHHQQQRPGSAANVD